MSQAFCKLKGLLVQKKSDGSSCIDFRTQKELFEEAKFSECSQGELLELIPLILGNVGEKDKRNWCVGENKPSLKVCSESGVKLYAFYGRCSNHGSPPQSKEIARYSYKSSTKCRCKASFIIDIAQNKIEFRNEHIPLCQLQDTIQLKNNSRQMNQEITKEEKAAITEPIIDLLKSNEGISDVDCRRLASKKCEDLNIVPLNQPVPTHFINSLIGDCRKKIIGGVDKSLWVQALIELLENDKDRFVYSVLYDDSDARGDDTFRVVAAIYWHDKLNTLKEGKCEKDYCT